MKALSFLRPKSEVELALNEAAKKAHADRVDPTDCGANSPMFAWIQENVAHDTDGFYLTFLLCGRVADMRAQ